jgi:PIN domain nuclease of toxin-antitoxin system
MLSRLLLDTHIFLWFAWDDRRLSRRARDLIEDGTSQPVVSAASIWEIAIKVGTGKLSLAKPLDQFLSQHLDGYEMEVLPIERRHSLHVAVLPFHHRDPFDRMLAAQSLIESLPLISADPIFDAYGVTRLW